MNLREEAMLAQIKSLSDQLVQEQTKRSDLALPLTRLLSCCQYHPEAREWRIDETLAAFRNVHHLLLKE